MATMERRKTMTMNWDGLGDDDDDMEHFLETYNNRVSTAVPRDLASSSDEEDFEDSRLSFASNFSTMHSMKPGRMSNFTANFTGKPNYDIWMAAPGSITERRRKLLGTMGLDENKELLQATSAAIARAITKKFENSNSSYYNNTYNNNTNNINNNKSVMNNGNGNVNVSKPPTKTRTIRFKSNKYNNEPSLSPSPPPPVPVPVPVVAPSMEKQKTMKSKPQHAPFFVLVRSRSDGDIDSSMEKLRKEDIMGKVSKHRLTRTATVITRRQRASVEKTRLVKKEPGQNRQVATPAMTKVGAFFLIKNLDTGKEFIVNEYGEDGGWNRLSDLQTGKQLTMEEFEKSVGHSSVVKEVMKRAKRSDKKLSSSSYISRSLKLSKRHGASLLKNIKGVGSGIFGEREREPEVAIVPVQQEASSKVQAPAAQGKNEWVRVRQTGKSQKEFSALQLNQEFQAHDGCVWTLKFSLDAKYLASAGEDKMIHVWEVQECDVMSLRPEDGSLMPINASLQSPMERVEAPPLSADKKKKGKNGSKRGGSMPDYVHVPDTVFSLSDKPFCSFTGHLDEVLDLSWSKSQLLLSSSMDKTVRLWDLETKACLKFFAHNDYVTCVQFSPIDEDYFISGSLDGKIRIWNISARSVADWTDINEMATAISYSPDGLGVIVGTQKGNCRTYTIDEDNILTQSGTIEVRSKKKVQLKKKVTGFQFAPNNPSEVLISSADSRLRLVESAQVVQKFKGFRNVSSQIAASFSPNGRYVICASEDSQVFVWKYEDTRSTGTGKAKTVFINQSHEHFPCKDVSVAIPWPGIVKGDPPPMPNAQNPKKNNTKSVPAPAPDNKGMLPPLPKKSNNNATESVPASEDQDPAAISQTESGTGDSMGNSKGALPPVPKKSNNQTSESDSTAVEEDPAAISRTDEGLDDSFGSGSASLRDNDPASISAAATPSNESSSSNYSPNDGSNGASAMNSSAWGMVIVTAGFGGEIRCYQNFGLPRKINLFLGPA